MCQITCSNGKKVKGKVHSRKSHEGPEVKCYSSTLSLTSALDGVGGQRQAPAVLPPGKTRYTLYKRLGGPRAGLDGCGKSRPSSGFHPRTIHSIDSRYTD